MTHKLVLLILMAVQLLLAGSKDEYLILISWDGCRWDYLNRGLTPNIQNLIESGVKAESLQPVFPSKTFPNHYSIVTGLYPENHKIVFNNFIDPRTEEGYRRGKNDSSIYEDKWYGGETLWMTAKRQHVKSACMFWPGSETYEKSPDYFRPYDHYLSHQKRIDQIIDWLEMDEEKRPHFLTLYFADADDAGHKYGPDSAELNNTLMRLDSTLGVLLFRLKKIGLYDKTNIMMVSDHGMTQIYEENSIDLTAALQGINYKRNGNDPVLTFFVEGEQRQELYTRLKKMEKGFKTFRKSDIPDRLHFKSSNLIGDIVVMADPGYYFYNPNWKAGKGAHGFDNALPDMQGIFVARGPAFKQNYKTGPVKNIDIYPLMCKVLDLQPNSSIDGRLERVSDVLR